MAISAPMADAMSRINQIRTRFEPPVRSSDASSAQSSSAFSSVLASSLDPSSASGLSALLGGDDGDGGIGLGSGSSIDLTTLGGTSIAGGMRPPGAMSDDVTGTDAVADAMKYLGIPYRWGGTDPSTGLDCSGLVQRVYGDLGIDLPRVSQDQARMGTEVASIADAKPGDLVAFGQPVDHIAIYAGNGKIVQAPHTGDVVKVSDIKRPITTIRRIIPDAGTGPTVAGVTMTSRSNASQAYGLSAALLRTPPTPGATGATGAYAQGGPLSPGEVQGQARYQALFDAAGAKYGVRPELLASVARAESGFNPAATSSAGAVGLMQFMPATAAGLGIDPTDPAQAVDGAARYLSTQIRNLGSVDLAVAAYNAGPGAVHKYGGIPPFSETRNYVNKVMGGLQPALAASGRTS